MDSVLESDKSDTEQHQGMYLSKRCAAYNGKAISPSEIVFIEDQKAL